MMTRDNLAIGKITNGGLQQNLVAELTVSPEDIPIGANVVVTSRRRNYYGLVVNISHAPVDPRYATRPLQSRLPASLARRIEARAIAPHAELMLTLSMDLPIQPGDRPGPAVTLPPLHSAVSLASAEDIARIYHSGAVHNQAVIGYTRELGHPIPIDLNRLLLRSAGFFGATGSGKTYLTRILLSHILQWNCASTLVFDMHNEYSVPDNASDTGDPVPGLQSLFRDQMRVIGLGPDTTIRSIQPDDFLLIDKGDIQPEDVSLLANELDLVDTAPLVMSALVRDFGRQDWLRRFLRMSYGKKHSKGDLESGEGTVADWAGSCGVPKQSAQALWWRLNRLRNRRYIVDNPSRSGVGRLIGELKAGKSIVLSFGKYQSDLDYLLVTNLLTRRISAAWEREADSYRSSLQTEIRPLVILIEEAHKFLNRDMAKQTIICHFIR